MLRADLGDQVRLAACRGDLLTWYYAQSLGLASGSPQELSSLVIGAVNNEAPDCHRPQDIRAYVKTLDLPTSTLGSAPCFDTILAWFNQLFVSSEGGYFCSPDVDPLSYRAICLRLHPFTLVAAGIAKQLSSGKISEATARQMAEATTGLCTRKPPKTALLVDNHVHLGGSGRSSLVLSQLLTPRDTLVPETALVEDMTYAQGFPLLRAGVLNRQKLHLWLNEVLLQLHRVAAYPQSNKGSKSRNRSELPPCVLWPDDPIPSSSRRGKVNATTRAGYFLHLGAIATSYDTKLLTSLIGLWLLELEGPYDQHRIQQVRFVISTLNLFYNFFTMSRGTGLENFIGYFHNSLRYGLPGREKVKLDYMKDTISHIFQSGIYGLDAKVSWQDRNILQNAFFVGQVADQELHQRARIIRDIGNQNDWPTSIQVTPSEIYSGLAPAYHFTIHFTKRADKDREHQLDQHSRFRNIPRLDLRHAKHRQDLAEAEVHISAALYDQHFRRGQADLIYANLPDGVESKRCKQDVSRLIRGLDAAGNETLAPPETYAPVINVLRNPSLRGCLDAPHPDFKMPVKPYLSVHAGEDFSHMATGIRRVFECLSYYKMGKLDSLGHGLAVGENAEEWYKTRVRSTHGDPNVFVDAITGFEDLIWAYRLISFYGKTSQGALAFLARAEHLIRALENYLWGLRERGSPLSWWSYWQMKSLDPDTVMAYANGHDLSDLSEADRKLLAETRHDYEAFRLYHFDPDFNIRARQPIQEMQSCADYYAPELFGPEILTLLQEITLEEIRRRDVTLECCPTSNLVISDAYLKVIERIQNHPIFRWHPPDDRVHKSKRINVVVNTDNSQIFATNLASEYDILEKAALANRFEQPLVTQWIERLRKAGLQLFADRHATYWLEDKGGRARALVPARY